MRKFLIFVCVILLSQNCWAQPQIIWQTSLLDTLDEGFETIAKSPTDGGFFAGGGIAPKLMDDCGKIYTNGQAWICKFDANKNLLWSKCYGGSNSDGAIGGIIGLPDGGCAVLAQTTSNDGDVSGNHGGLDPIDFWVFRLDVSGNLLWQRCYGGSNQDAPFSWISTLDHGYLMMGYTNSFDGDVGAHIGSTSLESDAWVVKLDSSFEIEWSRVYGGTSDDDANYGLQLADSSYIIAGQSSSSDYDLSANYGNSDGWIMKLDPTGNVIWSKAYGGIEKDLFNEVQQTQDGGFVMCGTTSSNIIFTPAVFAQGNIGFTTQPDIWVFRVDSLGNFIHSATFGGSREDLGRPCKLLPDGTLVITGLTESNDYDVVNPYSIQTENIWYLRVNEQDSIISSRVFGGNQFDVCWNNMLTDAGTILVSAYTYSDDGDVALNHSANTVTSDGWLFEIADPNGIAGINMSNPHMYIYPNPFTDEAVVNISGKEKGVKQNLILFNTQGVVVWKQELFYDYEATINRNGLPSGIYFLTLEGSKGEILTATKLIIQ